MNVLLPRSWLYVPGNKSDLVKKASNGSADAIVIDFEDAVLTADKPVARSQLIHHVELLKAQHKLIAVRVNGPKELLDQDLEVLRTCVPDYLILPKVESPSQIQYVVDQMKGFDTRIIGLIESPIGVLNAPLIAQSHKNLVALSIGSEDLSFEMQMQPCWDSLYVPSMQVNIACKAAGILCIGYIGSIAEFRELDRFKLSVERSAPLGFLGGFAIHPAQVVILNEVFTPSGTEIELARRIVKEFSAAQNESKGAIAVDGKMVDLPVARRAQQLLERFGHLFD